MEDLFRKDALLDFWPSASQTALERVQSTTRFIIYASLIVFLINRDVRVLALGGLVLTVLYILYVKGMVPDGPRAVYSSPGLKGFSMPTRDNPMANHLMGEPDDKPSAPWYPTMRTEVENQWKQIHPFERIRDTERNFYTTASSTIPNDQAAFAQAAYGRPFEPQCRDTPWACDPEGNPNARFPERPQMRGGNGR